MAKKDVANSIAAVQQQNLRISDITGQGLSLLSLTDILKSNMFLLKTGETLQITVTRKGTSISNFNYVIRKA